MSKTGSIARWNVKLGEQLEKTIIGGLTGGRIAGTVIVELNAHLLRFYRRD